MEILRRPNIRGCVIKKYNAVLLILQVRARVLVIADGATSKLATKLGYCKAPPKVLLAERNVGWRGHAELKCPFQRSSSSHEGAGAPVIAGSFPWINRMTTAWACFDVVVNCLSTPEHRPSFSVCLHCLTSASSLLMSTAGSVLTCVCGGRNSQHQL